MPQSETIGKLAAALAAAQAEITAPKKNKTGKIKGTTRDGKPYEYEYHYADLAAVIEARKVGAKQGLAITQGMEMREGYLALITRLMHSSGEWVAQECPIPAGLKPQELGAYLTYMRRYSEGSAWGIAAEDDDDGKAASEAVVPHPAPREVSPREPGLNGAAAEKVRVALKAAGCKTAADAATLLMGIVGVERVSQIPEGEVQTVLEHLAQVKERGPSQ